MMLRFAKLRTAGGRFAMAVALTLLTGHVVDRTTGQPLVGVAVSIEGAPKVLPAHTDDSGKYTLHDIPPGHYTISVSSDDVPPQTFDVTVRAAKSQDFKITACSTTLDYSCAAAQP